MNGFQDARMSEGAQNVNHTISTPKERRKMAQDRLKEVLEYDHKTGIFTWRINRTGTAKKGTVAGASCSKGYRNIAIDGLRHWAHRLAWLYVYGYIPENDIDHIDRNPSNNKINNLREVSVSCNMRNSRTYITNKSGVRGVNINKLNNKWRALIRANKKQIYLGDFIHFKDAVKARYNAEIKYKYPNCSTTSSAKLFLESIKEL